MCLFGDQAGVGPVSPPAPLTATDPIFIIGSERSGSNLLRLILHAHSAIVVPHPPHILKFFTPLLPAYGDLKDPRSFRRLVDDVLGLIAAHISPWEVSIAASEICQSAPRSLVGIFVAVYDQYLRQSGKRRWGCKSTFVIDYLPEVMAACPGARFLFLVRDPRDVAASARLSIFSPFHPYFTARLWQRQQSRGLAMLKAAPGQFLIVRYEDLLAEPEATVKGICAFVGEEYEAAMLEFYQTEAAKQSGRLSSSWKNTDAPILPGNRGKFRQALKPGEIRLVEAVAGELMGRFGYVPEGGGPLTAPPPFSIFWYRWLDCLWRLRIELRAMRHDANYPLHWRRRLFLLGLRLRCQGRLWLKLRGGRA